MCWGLITWCNKYTSPTIVTSFWPVQVPTSIVLSNVIFDTVLHWSDYVGASLIIVGLLVVCYTKYTQEKEENATIQYSKLPSIEEDEADETAEQKIN